MVNSSGSVANFPPTGNWILNSSGGAKHKQTPWLSAAVSIPSSGTILNRVRTHSDACGPTTSLNASDHGEYHGAADNNTSGVDTTESIRIVKRAANTTNIDLYIMIGLEQGTNSSMKDIQTIDLEFQ